MDEQRSEESMKTKVVLLGTGTPNARPDRSGSSLAITTGEGSYLVDFGPGVVRRINQVFYYGGPSRAIPGLTNF